MCLCLGGCLSRCPSLVLVPLFGAVSQLLGGSRGESCLFFFLPQAPAGILSFIPGGGGRGAVAVAVVVTLWASAQPGHFWALKAHHCFEEAPLKGSCKNIPRAALVGVWAERVCVKGSPLTSHLPGWEFQVYCLPSQPGEEHGFR